MKRYITPIILALIIIVSIFLRLFKLNLIPPSLSWDEASFSYNAYTIANWGKDEWGKTWPLSFRSFGEYKNPVDIYVTAPFIKLFGLNEFATRLPAALFGVANVVLIYFLVKLLFKSEVGALASSFFLAVSPYNLQFSRHHHELNIAVFFFMLGIYLFYRAINGKHKWLAVSVISFCLSMLTYNAAKIVVPLMGLTLVILYWRRLWSIKKYLLWSLIPLVILAIMLFTNKSLLGLTRFQQASANNEEIYTTWLYKKTGNRRLGRIEVILKQYPLHFSWRYLFASGDANPRHSIQTVGEFYKADLPFLVAGVLYLGYLIIKKKSKDGLLLIAWALIAPIPSALANEAPHAGRSMFMTGSWHAIAALGVVAIFIILKNKFARIAVASIAAGFYIFCIGSYLKDYYRGYSTKYAIEWQYGMKQIVGFLAKEKGVKKVYVTIERSQPYIFFLYYLKTSLPDYLNSFKPNAGPTSGASNINSFGKYNFGGWNTVESIPADGEYYVLTPSEYSGLRYINSFNIRRLVTYPNGTDAFYIITSL